MRSRKNEQKFVASIAPDTNRTSTTTGSTVDTLGVESCTIIVQAGTVTDGTWTPSLLESADNSSFSPVDAGDLDGSFVALTAGLVQTVGYLGAKRYLQVKLTKAGGSTGAKFAAGALLGDPRYAPVS